MDLLGLLQSKSIDFRTHGQHHHASQGWVNIDCPECSPHSHRFRLGIHLNKLFASCWCCGWKPLERVLGELTRLSPQEVKERIGSPGRNLLAPETKRPGKVILPSGLGPLQLPHRSYLASRGFDSRELSEVWGLKGIGIAPTLSWRVWIPIHYQGEVVSWTTRSISDKAEVRYKNARPEQEKISAKKLLFGEDYCLHTVLVCEGPLDAMAVGVGCVATLGMTVSSEQVRKISKYPRRVLVFDSEPGAQKRAKQLCNELSLFPGETFRVELSGKDAASSPKEEILELRKRFLT